MQRLLSERWRGAEEDRGWLCFTPLVWNGATGANLLPTGTLVHPLNLGEASEGNKQRLWL